MLALSNIDRSFGGFRVLQQVSVEVPKGGLVGIVGTNGAGKSTLFAIACGQLLPESGKVSLNDRDITDIPVRRRTQLGLGRTFQVPREFRELSVRENLLVAAPRTYGESLYTVFCKLAGTRDEERKANLAADDWLRFLNLQAVADKPAGGLSGGQKKLLELGRVLMLSPSYILLDEPFAGVNPVLIDELAAKILQLNQERGIAFMVIEHHLEALKGLVEKLYVMDQGKVIAQGQPSVVLNNPRVHEAYMGGVI